MTLKNDIKYLSLAIKKHESRNDMSVCCNHTIANVVEPLNISVEIISGDLATMKEKLEKHLLIFKKLFGSDEELLASNISLDVAKIQSMLTKKVRRQEKGQDKQRDKKRPEKQRENTQIVSGRNRVQTELLEKGRFSYLTCSCAGLASLWALLQVTLVPSKAYKLQPARYPVRCLRKVF